MKIVWTRIALEALEDIADYIAADNPRAAYRVTETIRTSVERLAEFPNIGREGRVEGTRELVITGVPYIVPYRVRESAVEILTVFHTSRRWPDSFED